MGCRVSDGASQQFGADELRGVATWLAAAASAHDGDGDGGQAAIDLTVASGMIEAVISRLTERSHH